MKDGVKILNAVSEGLTKTRFHAPLLRLHTGQSDQQKNLNNWSMMTVTSLLPVTNSLSHEIEAGFRGRFRGLWFGFLLGHFEIRPISFATGMAPIREHPFAGEHEVHHIINCSSVVKV